MSLRIAILRGPHITAALDDVARLRIAVFRDWPYLYDGDMEYERAYLARYADNPSAILVGAFDGAELVGASTGTPLEHNADDFGKAFQGQKMAMQDVFYCAESVLLPAYRGQGAGRAFFEAREAHARALKRKYMAFCAVRRPSDHPMKPANYHPLDPMWRALGFAPMPGVAAEFSWRDVGGTDATTKPLDFWIKPL